MRNLGTVIDKILAITPAGHPVRDALDKVIFSIGYTAPEVMYRRWSDVSDALKRFLGEPDEPWKKQVAAIFNDTEEQTI